MTFDDFQAHVRTRFPALSWDFRPFTVHQSDRIWYMRAIADNWLTLSFEPDARLKWTARVFSGKGECQGHGDSIDAAIAACGHTARQLVDLINSLDAP